MSVASVLTYYKELPTTLTKNSSTDNFAKARVLGQN